MKIISDAAMAAIAAREAIVTGAVEIAPLGSVATVIPTGTAIDLAWWQNTFVAAGSNQRMGVAFLTPAGVQVGSTTWSSLKQPTSWTQYSLSVSSPIGAAIVRVYMEVQQLSAAHHDGYIDDIELTIGGNLVALVNPGAESGMAGWTVDSGSIISFLEGDLVDTSPGPDAHGGTHYFAGGTSASDRAYQDFAPYPATESVVNLWGGPGPITFGGSAYQGVGDRAFAQQTNGALGGVAQGMTLGLSGIEPAALDMIDTENLHGAAVVLHRLIFASDGKTLLDHAVWDRGRVDTINTDEVIGGVATISLAIESAARGLGRSLARRRADADQRLIDPADGYFKGTAGAPFKTLYWGGRKPTHWGGSATRGFT